MFEFHILRMVGEQEKNNKQKDTEGAGEMALLQVVVHKRYFRVY